MAWTPELQELEKRKALAVRMGGPERVKRQHDGGRLTIRERIDRIADGETFREIGAIAGVGDYDEKGDLQDFTPANCIFGRAKVDGRPVVIVGDDFTVRGGSADASIREKPMMAAGRGRPSSRTPRAVKPWRQPAWFCCVGAIGRRPWPGRSRRFRRACRRPGTAPSGA